MSIMVTGSMSITNHFRLGPGSFNGFEDAAFEEAGVEKDNRPVKAQEQQTGNRGRILMAVYGVQTGHAWH